MILDQFIQDKINYSGEDAKAYISENDINVAALIWDTPHTFAEGWNQKVYVKQVARALNAVLIEHFDSIDEWLEAFNIDRHWVTMLWEGSLIPRKSVVTTLVQKWNVDPFCIWNDNTQIEFIEIKELVP